MIGLAVVFGYLVGSIPSADLAARIRGFDLRSQGSGNPGTANALRLGGRGLAATVLAMDGAKGAAATALGMAIGGHWAAWLPDCLRLPARSSIRGSGFAEERGWA